MDSWKELFGKTYEEIQTMKKTTPAGGIEPGPVPSDYSGSTFASCAWMDGWQAGRASTATASPQPKALVAAIRSLLRTACPSSPGLASVSLDALNDASALLPPLEYLTERSALQPEAPCEDLADTMRLDAARYRLLRMYHLSGSWSTNKYPQTLGVLSFSASHRDDESRKYTLGTLDRLLDDMLGHTTREQFAQDGVNLRTDYDEWKAAQVAEVLAQQYPAETQRFKESNYEAK